MLRILTHTMYTALSTDRATVAAHFLYGCSNFHNVVLNNGRNIVV